MDDFFNPPAGESEPSVEDFLAREAAALGPDAHAFGASAVEGDKDFEASASAFPDLDGDHELSGVPPASGTAAPSFGAEERGQVSVTNDNEFAAFEEEYPAVESHTAQDSQVSSHPGPGGCKPCRCPLRH